MSLNRVIGAANKIPWHLPEDFKWFKKKTTGHVIVMGRKTFESIGRPLPNRTTIVLSRLGFHHEGVLTARDLDALPRNALEVQGREIFICGGAEIYRQALPSCSELFLTQVKRVVEGDAFFPPFEDMFAQAEVILDSAEFKIVRYLNSGLQPGGGASLEAVAKAGTSR